MTKPCAASGMDPAAAYHRLLCALQILAGSGVNTNHVALVDEERHTDHSTGLQSRVLGGTGSGITAHAGFTIRDLKLYEHRGLYCEYLILVGVDLAGHFFLDKLQAVTDDVFSKRNLLKGLGVHEVIQIAVVVEILHFLPVDTCILILIGGGEGLFHNGTGDDVAQLGTNERCTLTRLYVLEFDDLHNLTVHIERDTVFEIACYYHICFLYPRADGDKLLSSCSVTNLHFIIHENGAFCNMFRELFSDFFRLIPYIRTAFRENGYTRQICVL